MREENNTSPKKYVYKPPEPTTQKATEQRKYVYEPPKPTTQKAMEKNEYEYEKPNNINIERKLAESSKDIDEAFSAKAKGNTK